MVEPLQGSGRVVALDSYFATIECAIQLHNFGLFSTMVIKKRAHWPALSDGEALEDKTSAGAVGSVTSRKGLVTDARGAEPVTLNIMEVGQKDLHRNFLVLSTWGTSNLIQENPRKRVEYVPLTDEHITHTYFRPHVIHNFRLASHSTDDLNRVRGGRNSLEDVWQTKSWTTRDFAFFLSLVEANALNIYNDIHHKKLSLQSFRRALVKEIIPVPAATPGEVAVATAEALPPSSQRLEHLWVPMPSHTRVIGGRLVTDPAFAAYPRRQCAFCGERSRHICICNPEMFLCEEHRDHGPFPE